MLFDCPLQQIVCNSEVFTGSPFLYPWTGYPDCQARAKSPCCIFPCANITSELSNDRSRVLRLHPPSL